MACLLVGKTLYHTPKDEIIYAFVGQTSVAALSLKPKVREENVFIFEKMSFPQSAERN